MNSFFYVQPRNKQKNEKVVCDTLNVSVAANSTLIGVFCISFHIQNMKFISSIVTPQL